MNGFETIYYFKQRDGNWSEEPALWHNRGFLFGDGLFETMIFQNGSIRFGKQHLFRIKKSMDILGMDSKDLSSLEQLEHHIRDGLSASSYRLRWNVFRAGQGKYMPTEDLTLESLQLQPFNKAPAVKFNAYFSDGIRIPESPWSQCKSLSALAYVMAAKEKTALDMDEVILKNTRDFISEAGSSNLFWLKNSIYYTPSLACSCIAGIGRGRVIQRLRDTGKTIIEGEFQENDLLDAEKVFTTNVTGASYLYKIEESKFDTTPDPWVESVFEGIN